MSAKTNFDEAPVRLVDDTLKIHELVDTPNFDMVGATLNGDHPTLVNDVSDRAYYILDGSGIVCAGNECFPVEAGDAVQIAKGTAHSIKGTLRYLIITSPPFDPANERVIEG